ncbi:MAG: cytochrome b [Gammaproteobacteria bacterium]|nr:cytochrome b [Gammaproteobacteria bacterium]
MRNTDEQYGWVTQGLHWAIFVLVAVQVVLGTIGADLPVGMERLITLARHKSLGMTIFALMLARLAWRLVNPAPALPAEMGQVERRAARAVHWLLYALLLTMPVVGWVGSSASNLTVSWFGLFTFPDLVNTDPGLAQLAKAVHRGLAWGLMALVTLHALAALRHHFLLGDNVLARMVPWLPGRRT